MSGGERLFSSTSDIKLPCYGKKHGELDKCKDCLFGYWCMKITYEMNYYDKVAALDKMIEEEKNESNSDSVS